MALEAKLVISAEDRTAKVFAEIEKRVASLNKAMSGIGGKSSLVSRMSSYFGGERDNAGAGRMRAAVRGAEAARRRHEREIAELRAYRREVGAGIGEHTLGLGSGLAAGVAAHEVIKSSAERLHERVRMQVAGMSAAESREAELESAKLAKEFPAIKQTEIMHMLRNARSIVGSYTEAAEIMEPLAKLRVIAQGARPGQDVSEDFDQLVKGLEIKGVTQDPKKFRSYMDGIAKGLNVFGDTLKPYQYYEMFKYGRQATPGLSEKFILGTAPTLAQELGGSSYGNAVAGFNRAIVAGRMEHSAIKELAALGLLKHNDVDWLKSGEAKGIKHGHSVQGWQIAQSDPNQWVRDFLLPALAAKGITDPSAIMKEIGTVFSNKVAAQLVSILATQQSRIDKDLALLTHAPGLSAAHTYMGKDPTTAYESLKHAIESLAATLGSPFVQAFVAPMNALTAAISKINLRFNENKADVDAGHEGRDMMLTRAALYKLLTGKTTDGSKGLLDADGIDFLDGAYERRRLELERRRMRRSDIPVVSGPRPKDPFAAEIWDDDHKRNLYPERAAADKELAELDRAHAARLRAQRDILEFRSNLKSALDRADPHWGFTAPGVNDHFIGPGNVMPTFAQPGSRRGGGYGGIDPSLGGPKSFGPYLPADGLPSQHAPDLASILSGKIEAHAEVTGQAKIDVNVVVTPGSELIQAAASAKSASMELKSLGSKIVGLRAAAGKTPTGSSMPEAAPTGRQGK